MGIKYRSPGKWSAFGTDASGNLVPGSGYKLYTYVPGTTTNKTTYLDKDGASSQTNPVVFDSRGEATIFWNGTYDLKLTDNNDVQIWTLSDFGAGEDYVNYGNYNLVSDGGFEDDTNGDGLPDQWTVTAYPTAGSGAGSAVLDSTTQIEGLNSLKFTSQGDGGGYAVSGFFNVREGSVIGLSWQMQSTAATVRNLVEVIWYTSAQVQISTSTIYDASSGNPTTWTEETGSATVPSTARFAKIRVTGCHSSVATTGSTWFDDVYVINNKTFSSSQLLDNNVFLQGNDTGSTARNLVGVNSSNQTEIGNTALNGLFKFLHHAGIEAGTDNFINVISGSVYISYGAYHNGTNWIATQATASIFESSASGGGAYYYDSGLTVSNSFTPTSIVSISSAGLVTATFSGNLTGNVTGNADTATSAAACTGNSATATTATSATTATTATTANSVAANAVTAAGIYLSSSTTGNSGSIGATNYYTLPAGIYMYIYIDMTSQTNSNPLQFNLGGTWTTAQQFVTGSLQTTNSPIYSDGTNVRVQNSGSNSPATFYWRKLA